MWGFLRWMLVDSAQTIGAVTGIAVGVVIAVGLGSRRSAFLSARTGNGAAPRPH